MYAKRVMRWLAGTGYRATGALARLEESNVGKLVILCYHRVLPSGSGSGYFLPDLVVTPEALRCHLATLVQRYQVHTLRDAWEMVSSGNAGLARMAAITFDDGYEDNYRFAAPILAEFGVSATFFVVTDIVGTDQAPWYDQMGNAIEVLAATGRAADINKLVVEAGLPEINESDSTDALAVAARVVRSAKVLSPQRRKELLVPLHSAAGTNSVAKERDRFMSWSQAKELVSRGHEIGSHTRTHELMTQLDDAELANEVGGSRAKLENEVPQQSYTFCYPNGDVDRRVADAVQTHGFACAVSVEDGMNSLGDDSYVLRRRFMHGDRLRGAWGNGSTTLTRMALAGVSHKTIGGFGTSVFRLCMRGAF